MPSSVAALWERLRPVLPCVGITRVADVTWLDHLGVPTHQAIRPESWTLAVSQGKALDHDVARLAAAMESLELRAAERVEPQAGPTTAAELQLPYDVTALPLAAGSLVSAQAPLYWVRARGLVSGADTWVPHQLICLDARLREEWRPPLFRVSSNGMGAGADECAAQVHALYEVIERDAIRRQRDVDATATEWLDPAVWEGPAGDLARRLQERGARIYLRDMTGPTGVPTYAAGLWDERLPLIVPGYGADMDAQRAVVKALLEAAQGRITAISSAREDLSARVFASITADEEPPDVATTATEPPTPAPQATVSGAALRDLLVTRIHSATGEEPLSVTLDAGIDWLPVVKVVAPSLRDLEGGA